MNSQVVYLPAAEEDIATVFFHYESQLHGLGHRFTSAIRDVAEQLEWMPEGYGEVAQGVRAATLRKFPYVFIIVLKNHESSLLR